MTLPPVITSRTNARVKELRAAFSGRASEPGELIGIEGEHLIGEAVAAGVELVSVYVREGSEPMLQREALRDLHPKRWVLLGRELFDSAVDTQSPQGIAATVKIPESVADEAEAGGFTLMLEDIQDPGNLGTLIRSAKAFATDMVWISRATVNPWNPKTVRASSGAIFSVAVARTDIVALARQWRLQGTSVYAAVASGGAFMPCDVDATAPCTWLIGNEGAGLSAAAIEAAECSVRIPCGVESLNAAVAGSLLMYESIRQQIEQVRAAEEATSTSGVM